MSAIAASIVDELREAHPDRSVEVNIEGPITAVADPGLINIVFSNFIGNAWKFTSKTEHARIEFGTVPQNGKIIYYVRDNGAGFDATDGNRNWVFAAEDPESLHPNGKPYRASLVRASHVPIKRHVKIKGEANPFDPKYETYFEERSTSQVRDTLKRSKRLLSLLLNQGGICPICRQPITADMQWSLHHITRKVERGNDNVSNLRLTHQQCHRKVHSSKLEVVQPVAERRLMKGLSRMSGN